MTHPAAVNVRIELRVSGSNLVVAETYTVHDGKEVKMQDSSYKIQYLLLHNKKERADSVIVGSGYDGRERYRYLVSGILNPASSIQ